MKKSVVEKSLILLILSEQNVTRLVGCLARLVRQTWEGSTFSGTECSTEHKTSPVYLNREHCNYKVSVLV